MKISVDALTQLNRWVDERGGKQWFVVDRIFAWFNDLPESVKQSFVQPGGDPVAEMMRLRMAQIAAAADLKGMAPVSVGEALKIIRLMTDRIEQIDQTKSHELKQRIPTTKKRG